MPFKSRAQKEYLRINEPEIYERWMREYGDGYVVDAESNQSFTPPAAAISAAKKGLAQRKKWGRGGLSPAEAKSQGIDSGVTRARKISSGKVSRHDVRRMSAFNRHRKNNNPSKKMPDGGPTAGTIAWNLWGGSAGVNWAKKKSAAMNAETFDAERNTQWDKTLAMINQYDMKETEGLMFAYNPTGPRKNELPPFFNKDLVDTHPDFNGDFSNENVVVFIDWCGEGGSTKDGTYQGMLLVSPRISKQKVIKQLQDWGIDTANHKKWENFGYFDDWGEGKGFTIYHFPLPNTSLHQWSNAYVRDTEYDDDGTAYTTFGQDCIKCGNQRRGTIGGDVSWDKNAETFVLGAETGFCPACGETDLMVQYYEDSGDFGCLECGHQWFEKTRMEAQEEEEEEEEIKTYEVSVPVLHYYGIGPVEAYDEEEAVDDVRNNWRSHWRHTIEDNGDWGGPLWRYSALSSHDPEAYEIFDSETFGDVDSDGQLAQALRAAREKSRRYAPQPLRITKLPHPDQKSLKDFEAQSSGLNKKDLTLLGVGAVIGVVSGVLGEVLAEFVLDRYRRRPELISDGSEENA